MGFCEAQRNKISVQPIQATDHYPVQLPSARQPKRGLRSKSKERIKPCRSAARRGFLNEQSRRAALLQCAFDSGVDLVSRSGLQEAQDELGFRGVPV